MSSDTLSAPAAGVSRGWLFAGTFLVALALLAFEVATVRTINFTVGPSHIYIAIALAMLGLSGAGSILSLFNIRAMSLPRELVLFWLCVSIALLLVASHFFVAEVKDDLNAAIAEAGRNKGILGIVRVTLAQGLLSALSIGLSLSLPYFLFGALLTVLFVTTEDAAYGRLYASDLIGAAIGCAIAILLMESTGYAFSVTAPAVVVLLGGAFYAWPASRRLGLAGLAGAALLAILPALDWYADAVEPRGDPNYLVRDYDYRDTVVETGRDWNSYTRVGALEWRGENARPYAMMSLANGDGMAWVWPYDPDRAATIPHRATAPAMLLEPPERALVMFAGVGADMMALHEYGAGHVTGVELNETLVEGGRTLDGYRTADFLDSEGTDLVVAEGRVFLERDENLYDLVLLSWSGATASYYAGALGGTTQFLFTYEGLSAALGHVKPGGYAVLLQINKINALATLERYVREQGHAPLSRSVVILFRSGNENVGWDLPWDDSPLLFKPSGWTDGDVERIVREGRRRGLEVAYAPGLPSHKDFTVYEQVVKAPDVEARIAALAAETGLRFGLVTDNRPFYLDLFPNRNYVDTNFWSGFFSGRVERGDHVAHALRVLFVAAVSLFALAIILGPLAFARGPARNRRSLYHLIYFFCLGGGFMILEIAIMQRAGLLFGNPGLTIAIVLAGIILFTGIGSLASDGTTRVNLSLRTVALLCAVYPFPSASSWTPFSTPCSLGRCC